MPAVRQARLQALDVYFLIYFHSGLLRCIFVLSLFFQRRSEAQKPAIACPWSQMQACSKTPSVITSLCRHQ